MKKLLRLFICIVVVATLYSCKKNDDTTIIEPEVVDKPDSKPDHENQPPNSFLLLTPESDSTIVNRTPTFSWEQATDPDGDIVTYDLYLGTEENPTALIAENLSTTSFKLLENLDFETQYFWKVVAKDDEGATRETEIQQLLVTIPIQLLTNNVRSGRGGGFQFDYTNGRMTHFNDLVVDEEGMPPRIRQLIDDTKTYQYSFTEFGKQREVYYGDFETGESWIFEYDITERLNSMLQVKSVDMGKGGIQKDSTTSVFNYDDSIILYPSSIDIKYPGGFDRFSLKWEGENIVEILAEYSTGTDDNFEFEGLLRISYDDNLNPFYPIFTLQFGLDPFFVLTGSPTRIESIDFGFFLWQSFNNITDYEVFDTPEAIGEPDEDNSYTKSYEYNEFYYPTSATVESIENSQETWIYKEQ